MIRRRLGDGDDGTTSSSAITYIASDCTQTDPVTGLCIGNVLLTDPSNESGSGAVGVGLPGDPGAQEALSLWAASNTADANSAALDSILPTFSSGDTGGNLGIGLIPIPSPITLPIPNLSPYLLIGAVALLALFMVTESNGSPARSTPARRRR